MFNILKINQFIFFIFKILDSSGLSSLPPNNTIPLSPDFIIPLVFADFIA